MYWHVWKWARPVASPFGLTISELRHVPCLASFLTLQITAQPLCNTNQAGTLCTLEYWDFLNLSFSPSPDSTNAAQYHVFCPHGIHLPQRNRSSPGHLVFSLCCALLIGYRHNENI
ncbi:hypothetical protein K474DRAFT_1510335 [Panus rudis PR-1116 ss-1]|nr:hypothetical protein K474DRAFT_1510335 [Panus rudis PR-1116 ss-1]